MRSPCAALLKKDFRLMLSGKFLLLALGSLILYSCYIHFVYAGMDQEIYPVYLYDPMGRYDAAPASVLPVESREALERACRDGYSVGIDASGEEPEIYMTASGVDTVDQLRAAYAAGMLPGAIEGEGEAEAAEGALGAEVTVLGQDDREMKNRREMTAEVLFFELAAVGFLGLASLLFKEKQMGVIRVHGVLPVSITGFMVSKIGLFFLSDLVFTVLLTFINVGFSQGIVILPGVLAQAGILSLIMALVGFFCAVWLPDFRQFSLLYLVLAVFITTPVFLAGQTGITWGWLRYHPMYHLFAAMKNAYFGRVAASPTYYLTCGAAIGLLFLAVHRILAREMAKEG